MNWFDEAAKLVASLLLFFSLLLSTSANISTNSLDSMIRDYAFKDLSRHRTGILYQVPLPANLSSIEASVVRLRSGNFWRNGANFTVFRIPPRTIPMPYVRRLIIVYQNLGNWSSSYYTVPGHSLVSPVVGFLAYDGSNTSSNSTTAVELKASGDPILITFAKFELPKGMNSTVRCARFGWDGSVQIGDMATTSACSTTSTGHFTIVVPSVVVPGLPPAAVEGGGGSRWWVWVVACGGGVVGLGLVGLVGMGIFKLVRNKKIEEMEGRADEGEALGSVWVGGSKMPSATMIRTQPVLETGTVP